MSPIVFILSPGSDPATDLNKLADRMNIGGNKLKFLAMGQVRTYRINFSLTNINQSEIFIK